MKILCIFASARCVYFAEMNGYQPPSVYTAGYVTHTIHSQRVNSTSVKRFSLIVFSNLLICLIEIECNPADSPFSTKVGFNSSAFGCDRNGIGDDTELNKISSFSLVPSFGPQSTNFI